MTPIRVLLIEDNPDDALLVETELRRGGFNVASRRVETEDDLRLALGDGPWDVILSDYALPAFTGKRAIEIVRQQWPQVPIIVVSGAIGEELAAETMRAGASDYVMKENLRRLVPAMHRELIEAQVRREQHRLADNLRRLQDRFHATFAEAPIGIATATAEGNLMMVNRRYAEFLGYETYELVGQPLSLITHPDDLAKTVEGLQQARSGVVKFEKRYIRRDGKTVWGKITVASVTTSTGAIEYCIGMVEDITAEREAAAALIEQGERLRAREAQLAETQRIARIGSWERDVTTGQSIWSDELYALLGVDRSTPPALASVAAIAHPDDRALISSFSAGPFRPGEEATVEFRILDREGRQRIMHLHGLIEGDETGAPVRIRGFVQDITERKEAEARLARQSAQQEAIAGLSRAALRGAGSELLFDLAARAAANVLECDMAEVVEQISPEELRVVAACGWPEPVSPNVLTVRAESWLVPVVARAETVLCADLDSQPVHPDDSAIHAGVRSGAAAPIVTGDGHIIGAVAVRSRHRSAFTDSDVGFLKAIGNVLAQAVERKRADDALQERAAQQAALAEFTRTALAGVTRNVLELACDLIMQLVHVEYCSVWELTADGSALECRAGRRVFDDGRILDLNGPSQLAYTARTDSAIVVDDYDSESRFGSRSLQQRGMRAGVSVAIRGDELFGVLTAHTRTARTFTDGDIRFIQSIANALAEAMQRDAAQRALVISEERYRSVVEGAHEIIFSFDENGLFTSLNTAFGRLTGWKREDWLGRSFFDIVAPPDRPRAEEILQQVVAGKGFSGEFTILASDGSRRAIEASVNPVYKDGRFGGVHGFAHDVTEQRRVAAERARLTRDLQLLLESTDEGIIAVDNNGRCTLLNGSAAEIIGAQGDAVKSADVHALLHPDCVECAFTRVLAGGPAERVHDSVFVRTNGGSFPVEFSMAPIVDAGTRKGAVLTFTDVTERSRLEAQLEQATRLTSLGRLAATIAHEFNNVLMGISPFVELLKRGSLPEERRLTSLEHIGNAVKRGKKITEEILRFTNPAEPVFEPVAVGTWIERVTNEMSSLLGTRYRIQVELEDPSLRVLADANQLHQIMSNLVINARDAMSDGGLITIRVRHESNDAVLPFRLLNPPDLFAHVTVEDQGTGIPAELLKHIFEPLFTTKRNGTGLGLAVTHQVVTRHGGELFVESTVGQGTRFHVFLPLTAETRQKTMPAVPTHRGSTVERILLVEDDVNVAAGMTALLQAEGIAVTVVERGADVLEGIERTRPDAILLDIGLPDIDGTQVFAGFASRYPHIPVIFSTGHGDERKIEPYLARGNVAMLLKPYPFEKLMETLTRVCRVTAPLSTLQLPRTP